MTIEEVWQHFVTDRQRKHKCMTRLQAYLQKQVKARKITATDITEVLQTVEAIISDYRGAEIRK